MSQVNYCMSSDEDIAFFPGTAGTIDDIETRVHCVFVKDNRSHSGEIDEYIVYNHKLEWLKEAEAEGTLDEYFYNSVDGCEIERNQEVLDSFLPDDKELLPHY